MPLCTCRRWGDSPTAFQGLVTEAPPAPAVPGKATGSSFARGGEDGTGRCGGVRCVARPSGTGAPQLRVESVWSGFVSACPCHPTLATGCVHLAGLCPGLPLRTQVVASWPRWCWARVCTCVTVAPSLRPDPVSWAPSIRLPVCVGWASCL